MERLTCDLVVIANEAGDVPLGKLPLHTGRGEAGVGAGQLGGCRQDRSEHEEGAAANGKGKRPPPAVCAGCRPAPAPAGPRHPPPQLPRTHVCSQQLGLQVPKCTRHPCPTPGSLRRTEADPSGGDRRASPLTGHLRPGPSHGCSKVKRFRDPSSSWVSCSLTNILNIFFRCFLPQPQANTSIINGNKISLSNLISFTFYASLCNSQ